MNAFHELAQLADICGILPSFYDLQGNERPTSPETQKALLAANGIDVSSDEAIRNSLDSIRFAIDDRWFPEEIIVETGVEAPQMFGLGATWELRLDGEDAVAAKGEPRDFITIPPLTSGIYELTATASGRTEIVTVIAAPKQLPSIEALTGADRLWGLNFALYGLQSSRNSGMGDFEDLAVMSETVGRQGASFVGINPLHIMGFSDETAISPYSPSHRGFLNTTYIALDRIPGLQPKSVADEFSTIRESETLKYGDHKKAHNKHLKGLYAQFKVLAQDRLVREFTQFKVAGGPQLRQFAEYEAVSEQYGADWKAWPKATDPASDHLIDFHMWLQWVADYQVERAQARSKASGMSLGHYLDLAVGPRRDGAESWCEQDVIATGVAIGAPPDHLSPEGQNWNLAAFSPRKLAAQRYAPLRRILAQTMKHAGIIRIDHVLGLNRSFWIPDDGSPGGYIYQPFDALLAVIKIEAERHNCVVIGEDLGLVPDGFRDTLRAHGFYGYSVMQYERDDQGRFQNPSDTSAQVLSCFATHDTPTVAGFETGRDIDWWHDLGWIDAETAGQIRRARGSEIAAMPHDSDFQVYVHTLLARSNAGLVALQLDDVLGVVEAQNLPGTIDQHPNWRRKYAMPLENFNKNLQLGALASIMDDAGRVMRAKGITDEN